MMHDAIFTLDLEPLAGSRAHAKGVATGDARRELEVQPDPKVARMTTRPTANLVDSATIAEGVVHGPVEGVGDKSQGIQEVALPGTVGPNQERERLQGDVAAADALIVGDHDPPEEPRTGHGPPVLAYG